MNQQPQSPPADTAPAGAATVGGIAARLDRLPSRAWHWKGVLTVQLFWASLLMMDALVLRLYPVVWQPAGTFSPIEYSFLVGFSNGLGPLIGVLILGPLADKYGRKKIMVACCVISALSVPPLSFVTDYWLVLLVVTITGIGVGGALVTVPAYAVEIVPPGARSRLMLGGQLLGFFVLAFVGTGIGVVLLPANPVAYVLTFSVIALALIPIVAFAIPESPRWLETHGKVPKADQIVGRLERSIERKGIVLPTPKLYAVAQTGHVPVRELFKGQYLKRTLVLLAVWLLVYAGINYGWQAFQSVYLVARGVPVTMILPIVLISAIGAIGAIVLGIVLNERVERKTYMLASTIVFCIGAAMYFFAGDSIGVIIPASILTGFGLSAVLATMYNYTAVAFPTRLRSTGITVTDGVGHIAAIFGAALAGVIYAATASANYIGWFLWVGIAGALLPGLILYFLGERQSRAILEELSE